MPHRNLRFTLLLFALPACDIAEREIGETRERWSSVADNTDRIALAELDGDIVVVSEEWTGAAAQPHGSPSRGLVTRLDANAEVVWQRAETHASLPNVRFNDVAVAPDGTVVAIGYATDERNDSDATFTTVVRAFSAAGKPAWAIESDALPDDLIAARADGGFVIAGNDAAIALLAADGTIGVAASMSALGDETAEVRGLVAQADGSTIAHVTHYAPIGVFEEVLALDATLSRTAFTTMDETGQQRSTSDGSAGLLVLSVQKSTPGDPFAYDTEVFSVVPGQAPVTLYAETDSPFSYHGAALEQGGVLALVGRLIDRPDADDSAAVIRAIDLESGEPLWEVTRRGHGTLPGDRLSYARRVVALASGDLAILGGLAYGTGWIGMFAGE